MTKFDYVRIIEEIDLLTTREAAYNFNVASICLSGDNCRKLSYFRRKFIFAHPIHLQTIRRVKYSSSCMKIIGSMSRSREQKRRQSLFPQCKTSIGNNSASTVSPEKRPSFFYNISYKTRAILITFGSFLNKFDANHVNVFHLTLVMSLLYLVKLKMLIAHVLPLSCQRKKLRNYFHLYCGLQIRQI